MPGHGLVKGKRLPLLYNRGGCYLPRSLGLVIFESQGLSFPEDHGTLNHIFEFPDISRPGIFHQPVHGPRTGNQKLLDSQLGHRFPSSPVFGVAPCPTAIFTFGLLLWSERRPSVSLLLITLIWAVVGSSAVVFLGVLENIGLITSGLLSASIIFLRGRKVNGREAKKIRLVPAGSR